VLDAQYTLFVDDPSEGWRGQNAEAGGGCIIDMGYHLIDMILWYFGLPDRVLADVSVEARPDREYDAEDTALVHFGYNSGLYGSVLLSRFIGPKTEQIRLVGNKGMVHLERGRIQRLTNSGDIIDSLSRQHQPEGDAVNSPLAILGGEPVITQSESHFSWPPVDERTTTAVLGQLQHGISIYNRSGVIEQLENGLRDYHGTTHAVLTSSGT